MNLLHKRAKQYSSFFLGGGSIRKNGSIRLITTHRESFYVRVVEFEHSVRLKVFVLVVTTCFLQYPPSVGAPEKDRWTSFTAI